MPITRIGLVAVPDESKQELAIKGFADLASLCKKPDGSTYIISSKAGKANVLVSQPPSAAWTVVTEITFASQADLDYYQNEDPVYQAVLKQNAEEKLATGILGITTEF
ncbi:uncharacterized protein B0I36DRAFT_363602 [Microdochium trichocladiopsis]|uniref:Stress-response A/B barrel domain-containing protein n=1 Tax=Microdochium trichocladiopsis TaxID=1682393 RepID=A0A9P8Y3E2_9PEZI|nr:uncharacterized protein B0I36DRAFT_363602 [Microdochium trichocladiopsis]KAH7028998.1 hypothetical protein B0I36DRAFT_363602 [Microdochium trichocladiopsis]